MSRRVRERDDQKNWVHTAVESRFFCYEKRGKRDSTTFGFIYFGSASLSNTATGFVEFQFKDDNARQVA